MSLSLILEQVTAEQLFGSFCNLEDVLQEIYNVGFLRYENICFEVEDIFLDVNSYRAYLVYLPIKAVHDQMEQAEFESYFKKAISVIIEKKNPPIKTLRASKGVSVGDALNETFRVARNGEIEVEIPFLPLEKVPMPGSEFEDKPRGR